MPTKPKPNPLQSASAILATLSEAGARHSAEDLQLLQSIHDQAGQLGASCPDPMESDQDDFSRSQPSGATQEADESIELSGDVIPLSEAKAIRRDGTARVRIISPGVGSSGFYSPEVLERDAGKFADARCFWDHPKVSDNLERPERSLRDLAGKIIGTPTWEASGASGPGIYADVQVFKPYQEAVEELAGHIGMSIRALGKAKETTIGGKKMPAIEGFESVKSVDFVTQPGRGGAILQLFEAARGGQMSPPATSGGEAQRSPEKGNAVDLQEAQTALAEATRQLSEAQATNAQLAERLLLREARDFADAELRGLNLPELTRTRLSEQLGRAPVVTDGKLDQDAFRTKIREAAKVELEYLSAITGQGLIRGMGGATSGAAATAQQVEERTAKAFRDLGLSEASALSAAKGRAG